jgi:hypothetical protein
MNPKAKELPSMRYNLIIDGCFKRWLADFENKQREWA